MAFGTLLRRRRLAAGLTQEDLAERAGLSRRNLGDLERGVVQTPHKETVALLADALGLTGQERAVFIASARRTPRAPDAGAPAAKRAEPPLVGRAREIRALEEHLAGDGPPLLLLAGEPGIGKSRLLQEAAQRAGAAGWSVIQGGCQRRGGQEPYAPLVAALERRVHRVPVAQARGELAGCVWLARLLPDLVEVLGAAPPAWTLTPEQERRLMFGAVARYLGHVAGAAGTLLVLDDLQWASADALDLVGTLVRGAETPLRVVGAYRSTEMRPDEPLGMLLADLAAAGLAVQRELVPLAPEDVRDLLDRLLEGTESSVEVRERVLQRTGGVPFFAVSCAQQLRQGLEEGEAPQNVPWDVTQSIRQRVAALPDVAQEVLDAAAVVGRESAPALLTAATGRPEHEVLDALDAATRARLLPEEARTYHFAHDVIREVIEGGLGVARRMALHRHVAEAFERMPGAPPGAALAYHYARSDAPDRAVVYLETAGDQALAQQANTVARGYYQEAVDQLDRLGSVAEAARVREKLGGVSKTLGQLAAAVAALEPAAETYRRVGDLESLGRVTALIAYIYDNSGRPQEGLRLLQPVLDLLASVARADPSPALIRLYRTLAFPFLIDLGRHSEAVATAQRAVDLARALGHGGLLAEAAWSLGLALASAGRHEEARGVTEEASHLAAAAGDLYILGYSLTNLGALSANSGDLTAAQSYADRAVAVAEQLGDPAAIAFFTSNRGINAFLLGAWEPARRDLERAVALSRQVEASWESAPPLLGLGQLCLAEGAWDDASRYLQDAVVMAERVNNREALIAAHALLAERDVLDGRPADACARLARTIGPYDWGGGVREGALATLAWAQAEGGDAAVASATVAPVVAYARDKNLALTLTDALRVQALAALRQARWEEAAAALQEGLALAQRLRYPYAEARLLSICGLLHAEQNEMGPARERWEAALAIFQRLGARTDAERTRQLLVDMAAGRASARLAAMGAEVRNAGQTVPVVAAPARRTP